MIEMKLYRKPLIWMLISLFLAFAPAVMLPKGLLTWLIIPVVILFIPHIGSAIQAIIYVWAIVRLFIKPFSWVSVIFILSILCYFYFVVMKFLINTVYIKIMEYRAGRS